MSGPAGLPRPASRRRPGAPGDPSGRTVCGFPSWQAMASGLLNSCPMRVLSSTVLVFAAACTSGSASFDSAPPGAPRGGNGGGGGVSFGGAQDVGEFRGILDRGEIPGPDTLDANGFFNEHFNAPPPASCGALLCAVPGMSVGRDWLACGP